MTKMKRTKMILTTRKILLRHEHLLHSSYSSLGYVCICSLALCHTLCTVHTSLRVQNQRAHVGESIRQRKHNNSNPATHEKLARVLSHFVGRTWPYLYYVVHACSPPTPPMPICMVHMMCLFWRFCFPNSQVWVTRPGDPNRV